MAKKRTTLVKNFDDIIASGDLAAFQAVFEKCDINATGGYGKGTALHCYGLSEEMIRWLVENGADLNAVNTYHRTPLATAAALRGANITVLIELGAAVQVADTYGNTPLHSAAGCGFTAGNVELLLSHGADALAKNRSGQTPLVYALTRASNIDLEGLVGVAELLLPLQREITAEMQQAVAELGKGFEFYRADFNPEYLPNTQAALNHLYALFQVQPVAQRKMIDGSSPIAIESGIWQKQFDELWELLVPGQGAASTVQGEVIRICGKVSREILENGAPNWSRDYKKLPQALLGYFAMGNPLAAPDGQEADKLAKSISANSDEETLDRLCELAVKWVLANPTPIALPKVDYER